MRADGRFGGHFVQGHVDGDGDVDEIRPDGDAHWLTISLPTRPGALSDSQGLDRRRRRQPDGGAARRGDEFDVMIIPFTWEHTSLVGAAASAIA